MFNRISDKEPAAWSKKKELAPGESQPAQLGSFEDWIAGAEKLIIEYPGAALMAAFLTGATIAWWLKRK